MDQASPPPIPASHSEVPGDTFTLSTAKPAMKTIKIEEGSRSRDDVDEKGAQSVQASGSPLQSILAQVDHLKSLITVARAQHDIDDPQRLVRIPFQRFGASLSSAGSGKSYFTIGLYVLCFYRGKLCNIITGALHDFDVAGTPADISTA